MASPSATNRSKWSLFRPRFGLASLLALVTFASIGSWYWWRRPFVVERTGLDISLGMDRRVLWGEWRAEQERSDPFAAPGDPFAVPPTRTVPASLPSDIQQSPAQTPRIVSRRLVIVREHETLRRLWGGKTIRHGLVTGFDDEGRKISETEFREGQRHGPSATWFRDGHLREQGEYRNGRKHGSWERYYQQERRNPPQVVYVRERTSWSDGVPDGKWEWFDDSGALTGSASFAAGRLVGPAPPEFDPGLSRRMIDGQLTDPKFVEALMSTAEFQFVETPLKDGIDFLAEKKRFPFILTFGDWKCVD